MSEAAVKTKKPSKVNARLIGDMAPYIGLVLVVVVFYILTGGALLNGTNIQAMANNVITTAMCTIGAVFVFAAGYFDMAVGGALCFSAVLGAMATISSGSLFVGAIVILAVSLGLGCIKATLASFVNVPFFIFTIILGSIFSAIVLVIMGKETTVLLKNAVKPIPELDFTQMSIISVICLAVFFILCLIAFRYTPIGPKAKNMGGNVFAAKQSGISKTKTTFTVFIIGAIGIAIAAFLLMLRTRTVGATTAGSVGNDVMVALVLGGMPLSGGPRSKISAGLIGSITITVLNSGLVILGLNTGEVQIIRGIVFIVVVLVSSLSYRGKLLPR
ncbi:MAG: ABC transporter permease [Parasporobacterium sp.]|nr:ABC transporter permease [Parasporobacterium sp.]